MAIIPKQYMNSVVSIGICDNSEEICDNSAISWIGTGFFVERKNNDKKKSMPFLVTNKHVVAGNCQLVIRMRNHTTGSLEKFSIPSLKKDEKITYYIHENAKVDIAVIPLNGKFIEENSYDFFAFDIDNDALDSEQLRKFDVDKGSLIYMLGYPMGLVNMSSSTPICRLGCIARMDKEQIESTNNILVDIQNFPGNSGSPIIYRPEALSIEGTKNLMNSVLIGIVHSYIPYRETLISSQTGEIVEIRSENSGLAYAHPVEYIRHIIDDFFKKNPNIFDM